MRMTKLNVFNLIGYFLGFGPFGNHTVNASWVAVQELALMGIANDVELITLEIPVEYDTVRVLVPELWNKYKPKVGLDYMQHSTEYDRELPMDGIEV